MKRRGFMQMLGLAPAVAALPVLAHAESLKFAGLAIEFDDAEAKRVYIMPTTKNGYYYKVTASTGSAEPAWPVVSSHSETKCDG